MSPTDTAEAMDIYKLDNYEPPKAEATSSRGVDDIPDNSLVLVRIGNHHLVMSAREVRNLSKDHSVVCYADQKAATLNKLNGERVKRLKQSTVADFLDGMVTALNLVTTEDAVLPSADETPAAKENSAPEAEPEPAPEEISECRDHLTSEQVQLAIKKALKLVSRSMEKNIDSWLIHAGDRLTKSASKLGIEDSQRAKSMAMQLQNSSAKLSKKFQTRLIECLHKFNHPEKEQIDISAQSLSLAEDGDWHKQTAILSLAATVTGQAKLDFNQLNRRFSYLLNRRVKPEKNVIGPEMLAWGICSAIDDMSMNKQQVEALQAVLTQSFQVSLGKLYREINLLWIGMDIIPQIKLRVWQDHYKPASR